MKWVLLLTAALAFGFFATQYSEKTTALTMKKWNNFIKAWRNEKTPTQTFNQWKDAIVAGKIDEANELTADNPELNSVLAETVRASPEKRKAFTDGTVVGEEITDDTAVVKFKNTAGKIEDFVLLRSQGLWRISHQPAFGVVYDRAPVLPSLYTSSLPRRRFRSFRTSPSVHRQGRPAYRDSAPRPPEHGTDWERERRPPGPPPRYISERHSPPGTQRRFADRTSPPRPPERDRDWRRERRQGSVPPPPPPRHISERSGRRSMQRPPEQSRKMRSRRRGAPGGNGNANMPEKRPERRGSQSSEKN